MVVRNGPGEPFVELVVVAADSLGSLPLTDPGFFDFGLQGHGKGRHVGPFVFAHSAIAGRLLWLLIAQWCLTVLGMSTCLIAFHEML